MRTVTIRFEFPDQYDHKEIVDTINGSLTDMDQDLANEVSYTIVGRS